MPGQPLIYFYLICMIFLSLQIPFSLVQFPLWESLKAGSSTAVGNVLSAMHGVWRSQGLAGLFAGVFPRMAAISMGGFIFLGAYDQTRSLLLEVGRKSP